MILPTALNPAAATRLVDSIRESVSASVMFKFCESHTRDACVAAFGLEPTKTFYTYTLSRADHLPPAEKVNVSSQLDEAALKLYLANGYQREEVSGWFAAGACSFTIDEGGSPVSSCFVYQNYANIWEIAAVHTLVSDRHKGYARQIVTAALQALISSGRPPAITSSQTMRPRFIWRSPWV